MFSALAPLKDRRKIYCSENSIIDLSSSSINFGFFTLFSKDFAFHTLISNNVMRSLQFSLASCLLMCAPFGLALDINLNDPQAVSNAAKTIVENIMSIYNGGNASSIPGLFPMPYYWWESGLTFDSLINYWAVTGDDTYNDIVSQGLLFQVGPNNDYMPPNQTKSEGNDDQATWALACMTAAERGFPAPSANSSIDSWLQLAQKVFDTQAARWDTKSCDGGLRWQIFPFNAGYDYKNSMSNGDFMQLAARLFHYTGNETYSAWASKVSKWSSDVGLIDSDTDAVYDGVTTTGGCKSPNKVQWTANLGTYLSANVYLFSAVSRRKPLVLLNVANIFADSS
jgi:mannan endo-1,6-alpha-mannosidase